MDKGLFKNILIVLFLTIALFSMFKYRSILKEKYALQDNLAQEKGKVANLEQEKQNLLQDIEKRKISEQKLVDENRGLKDELQGAFTRLNDLIAENNATLKSLEELQSRLFLLEAQNNVLQVEKQEVIRQNEELKARLLALEEAEMTGKESSAGKSRRGEAEAGNKGFLIKNGQFTYPLRVKINVLPAPRE